MKRISIVLILSLFLLCPLFGCSAAPEDPPASPPLTYSTFYASFVEYLAPLTDYDFYPLPDVALPEKGETVHPIVIKDSLLDRTYHLSVKCTEDGAVSSVDLSADRQNYTDLQFAVFSLYVYQALGLPDVDPNAFYKDFDMFSNDEKIISHVIEDWEVIAVTIADMLTFAIKK